MRRLHRVTYELRYGDRSARYTSLFTRSGAYSFTQYQKEQLRVKNDPPKPIRIINVVMYEYSFDRPGRPK